MILKTRCHEGLLVLGREVSFALALRGSCSRTRYGPRGGTTECSGKVGSGRLEAASGSTSSRCPSSSVFRQPSSQGWDHFQDSVSNGDVRVGQVGDPTPFDGRSGGRERRDLGSEQSAVSSDVEPRRLTQQNVTLQDVLTAVAGAVSVGGSGFLDTPNQRIPIRHQAWVRSPKDLERAVVVSRNGNPVTVGEVAKVGIGSPPAIGDAVIKGQASLLLIVEKNPWGNSTLEVTEGIEEALRTLSQKMSHLVFVSAFCSRVWEPKMWSFRGRLTLALTASTGLFLALFCLFLYFWCRATFVADLDGDLRAIASAELTGGLDVEHRFSGSEKSHSDASFHVLGLLAEPGGRVLKATDPRMERQPELAKLWQETALTSPVATSFQLDGASYRALITSVRIDGRELVEVLAISEAPFDASLQELRRVLGVALGLGVLMSAITSNLVAHYLTRPLDRILEQLKFVSAGSESSARLTAVQRDLETAMLQEEINAMLSRLERSFQAQRRLVSDASHELRAPLSNLTLAIEVCLRRDREIPEYREALETCRGEIHRLTQMCEALLTLSQSDEEGLKPQRQPTDLRHLLQSCQVRVLGAAEQRDVVLKLEGDSVEVPVDPAMIERVIENLLYNALRYAPPGSTVELSCRRFKTTAEVRIKDSGPGLSSEQRDLVFERFYRSDGSRQRTTGGAGLGLAIAREIVRAHQGEIGVDAVLGEGCEFWFNLPIDL